MLSSTVRQSHQYFPKKPTKHKSHPVLGPSPEVVRKAEPAQWLGLTLAAKPT